MESPAADATILPRRAEVLVREALSDTPVVLIQGTRQVGKSTLAAQVLAGTDTPLFTLDIAATYNVASSDPDAFVRQRPGSLLAIDEVQRSPELLRAIKAAVDEDRTPGRFLLTGSANLLTIPGHHESLAGRAETIPLYGLSQGEILGGHDSLADRLLRGDEQPLSDLHSALTRADYLDLVCDGSYPEARLRRGRRRHAWFDNYLKRIVDRDARDLSRLTHIDRLPHLIRLLSGQQRRRTRQVPHRGGRRDSRDQPARLPGPARVPLPDPDHPGLGRQPHPTRYRPPQGLTPGHRSRRAPNQPVSRSAQPHGSRRPARRSTPRSLRRRRTATPKAPGPKGRSSCSTSATATASKSTSSSKTTPATWPESRSRPQPASMPATSRASPSSRPVPALASPSASFSTPANNPYDSRRSSGPCPSQHSGPDPSLAFGVGCPMSHSAQPAAKADDDSDQEGAGGRHSRTRTPTTSSSSPP